MALAAIRKNVYSKLAVFFGATLSQRKKKGPLSGVLVPRREVSARRDEDAVPGKRCRILRALNASNQIPMTS